ncbi:hypothetical protein ISCGN_014894 [Ixodes scapularis]
MVLFSGEVLQSTAEMSSQARIRKKKTLEKISLPNYSQQDTKTFRTSMHMELVEDEEEDSRDKEPSENANTIVIETTVKSPEVKASAQTPPQEPDYAALDEFVSSSDSKDDEVLTIAAITNGCCVGKEHPKVVNFVESVVKRFDDS